VEYILFPQSVQNINGLFHDLLGCAFTGARGVVGVYELREVCTPCPLHDQLEEAVPELDSVGDLHYVGTAGTQLPYALDECGLLEGIMPFEDCVHVQTFDHPEDASLLVLDFEHSPHPPV